MIEIIQQWEKNKKKRGAPHATKDWKNHNNNNNNNNSNRNSPPQTKQQQQET